MTYTIELTAEQLHLVHRAIEMMMRTGLDQPEMLAEWIVTKGRTVHNGEDYQREFDWYVYTLGAIKDVLRGVMAAGRSKADIDKSPDVLELETIYEAVGHRFWLDQPEERRNLFDIRADQPIKWGNEPVPKIERVEE